MPASRRATARAWLRAWRARGQRTATPAACCSAVHQRLQAQDPHRVLRRGYAWVQAADGRPVVSVRTLRQGQAVRAVWADGTPGRAEVLKVEPLLPTP
jgi:exodeoxyribonuclease VII large subunit